MTKKVVTGARAKLFLNGKEVGFVSMSPACGRTQRLCWLLAKLGIKSAKWHLPVGINVNGSIDMNLPMPD